MPDNVTLPGTGEIISADEVGGAKVQRVKVTGGADGTAQDVGSTSNELHVRDATARTTLGQILSALSDPASETTLAAVLAALGGTLAVDASGSVVVVSDGGGSLTVDGAVTLGAALPAGTNTIGKLGANSGVDIGDVDVTSLPALATGSNTIGRVGLAPQTSGGLLIAKFLDLDEVDQAVKASAGQLFGWYLFNSAATTHYVKLYNATTANVTVGTTTPVLTVPVPAGSAANVEFTNGIEFATAITAACVTGLADNNTGAPAANAVTAMFFYK